MGSISLEDRSAGVGLVQGRLVACDSGGWPGAGVCWQPGSVEPCLQSRSSGTGLALGCAGGWGLEKICWEPPRAVGVGLV